MIKQYLEALKYYLLAAALLASAIGGYKVADWHWQSKWDGHMLADAQVNEKAATEALTKQLELLTELEKVKADEKQWQEKYANTAAANDAANDRLRDEFKRLKDSMSATDDSGIVSISAAAATDRIVLAGLLEQSHAENRILAQYADKNRRAVINCSNEYNAIRMSINGK